MSSHVTCTTQTSDELANTMKKMAPTTQRPASANFATHQRVRRIGSFASSSSNSENNTKKYQDRVPVRLVFKHERLEKLAEAHLKSRVV